MFPNLNVQSLRRFLAAEIPETGKQRLSISQPQQIATYSYDSRDNKRPPFIKKYKQPELPINLLEGYTNAYEKIDVPSPLDNILSSLIDIGYDVTKVSFITFRNNINKIFGSAQDNDNWTIDIQRLGDTIHLGVNLKSINIDKKATYAGTKFESFCTTTSNNNNNRNNNNNNQVTMDMTNDDIQFCSITTTSLIKNRFVIASEIDCYLDTTTLLQQQQSPELQQQQQPILMNQYIELKTANKIKNDKMRFSFEKYRLFKYWLQSYFAGVPKIVCGFKNPDLTISEPPVTFKTLEIPSITKRLWSVDRSLAFGDSVLEFIKSNTKPGGCYLLSYNFPTIELQPSTKSILNEPYIQYFEDLVKKNNSVVIKNNRRKLDDDNDNDDNDNDDGFNDDRLSQKQKIK